MAKQTTIFSLTKLQKQDLEQLARSRTISKRESQRAQIILHYAGGLSKLEISRRLQLHRSRVIDWIERFREKGIDGLEELPGRGRPEEYSAAQKQRIVDMVCKKPPKGLGRWTVRTLASELKIDKDKVHRVLEEHDLHPHRLRTFNFSPDPRFEEKLLEVVGLYMAPPENAVVLCVDEKSQIQALDRTQPGLPLKPGRCGTFTHDYQRNGTTTLFAALHVLEGRVIGQCYSRHRHQEFLKFLRRLDAEFPGEVTLHLILDNYGTHGHERVRRWLAKHPRFVLHFIPTSASWLNLVERWFAELSQKAVRRGAFRSVKELQRAIQEFMTAWNANPSPFVWTASVEKILEKFARCQHRLEQIQPGCTKLKRKIKCVVI